ncbi:MAG: hypothetical protein IKN04_08855 [Clostridia bacterium]|nr:hypothetical protein [Clostridia bacterium]MBR6186802.1 hypothetical protein [Clostridia bacterium]
MSEEKPKVQLFREKSLEAVDSPESLNDYLRVTSPGIWLVMAAVIALLAGGILWGIFGHIRTTAKCAVSVSPEKSICYVSYDIADKVLDKGIVHVEGADYPLKITDEYNVNIVSEETPPRVLLSGDLRMGDLVVEVPVIIDLPEGVYTGEVVTEDLKPISLLLQ